MRIRFSLRLALVVLALAAAALYWCVVRPTILANRFVAAMNRRDFASVERLLPDFSSRSLRPSDLRLDLISTELFPREWADLRAFQRRIVVRISHHYDRIGQHVDWTEDIGIVVRPGGLELETPFAVDFPHPDPVPANLR